MLNDQKTLCLYLEDYSVSRRVPSAKPYFGTMDDMNLLKTRLEEDFQANIRYSGLIEKIEFYDLDWDMTHIVSGMEYKLLYQTTELCRCEISLEDQNWECKSQSGILYPLFAKSVNVSRLLVQHENGHLYRCIKVNFDGLKICAPGIGWYIPNGNGNGFPGMISVESGIHSMLMYVCEQCYAAAELDEAMADTMDVHTIDLAAASRDILGEV